MTRKYFDLTILLGDSRLNYDPKRLRLFMQLLMEANERGELLFNASEYAKQMRIDRTAMSRLLDFLEDNGFIAKEKQKNKTWITICNYDFYISIASTVSANSAKETQREEPAVEENEKNEKKSTPLTPLKEEKEKKEKTSIKNNNKRDYESCGSHDDDLCYSSDNKYSMKANRVRCLQKTPIEEREKAFLDKFDKYIKKRDKRGRDFLHRLKEWTDKENIINYFNSEQLVNNFSIHWRQKVQMIDSEGEEVGEVLLHETQGRWDWWNRLTSFVKKGYELKKEEDMRETIRQNKISTSKAQRRMIESNSQKAHAQAVAAKVAAGIGGEATEIDEARLMVGFDYFWRQYKVKANMDLAKAVWKKLSMQEKINAINGASPYCTYCEMENIKIVYPDKYLQNHRWTDDIPEEYYEFYDEEEEEAEEEAIRHIKEVYGEIDAEIDKKFEEQPEKTMRERQDEDDEDEDEDYEDDEDDEGHEDNTYMVFSPDGPVPF